MQGNIKVKVGDSILIQGIKYKAKTERNEKHLRAQISNRGLLSPTSETTLVSSVVKYFTKFTNW